MKTQTTDILIIGAGLTGLSLAYFLSKAGKNVTVIEKEEHIGGVINTKSEDGFRYETGPSTGVLGTIELVELLKELQGKCQLQTANKSAKKRYIWKKNRWHALPSSLFSAITTPLFTTYDKWRILGEPFRKKGQNPDETLSDLVVRRLGKSYLDYAVNPFISGVYAGDSRKLITRFALPKLYVLENTYGSFIRGAIAKQKAEKANKTKTEKVSREVFSVEGGLHQLIQALAAEVRSENIHTQCKNATVSMHESKYSIHFEDKNGTAQSIIAPQLVLSTGASTLAELLPFITAEKLAPIVNTTYAPVIHVAVGYKAWTGIKLDAFGGLISPKDQRRILGVLFPSAIFPNRAPENGALLSVFMGGQLQADLLQLSDHEICEIVEQELKLCMKVKNKPDLIRIHRYPQAIAQYDDKTEKRLEAISYIESSYPGLILAGSIRDGIGMADRVKQAKLISETLLN